MQDYIEGWLRYFLEKITQAPQTQRFGRQLKWLGFTSHHLFYLKNDFIKEWWSIHHLHLQNL